MEWRVMKRRRGVKEHSARRIGNMKNAFERHLMLWSHIHIASNVPALREPKKKNISESTSDPTHKNAVKMLSIIARISASEAASTMQEMKRLTEIEFMNSILLISVWKVRGCGRRVADWPTESATTCRCAGK